MLHFNKNRGTEEGNETERTLFLYPCNGSPQNKYLFQPQNYFNYMESVDEIFKFFSVLCFL